LHSKLKNRTGKNAATTKPCSAGELLTLGVILMPVKIAKLHLQLARRICMSITVGTVAPDFTLKDQSQKEVKLSDFAGKKNVVLMFYPLDWSPVCTNEHACMVNDMKSFETLDAEVLGVSVDSVWSHKAYAEKMGIHYSLLADFQPRGAMAEKYGVYLPEKGITGRSIIIVGKDGKVAWVKNYDIPVLPDLKEVASALEKVKSAAA
jgi:mycoredoxin-dependent peroxiredoxin